MNYRRKVEKAIAFKVPQKIEFADGQIALEGDWLVFQDGCMVIYSDLDFNSSFEPDIPNIITNVKPNGVRGIQWGDLCKPIDTYRQYYQPNYISTSKPDPNQTMFDQRG